MPHAAFDKLEPLCVIAAISIAFTALACERRATKDPDATTQTGTSPAPKSTATPATSTSATSPAKGEEVVDEDDDEPNPTASRRDKTDKSDASAKDLLGSHKIIAYASEDVILFASADDCVDEDCKVDWMMLDAKKDPRVLSRELTKPQAKRYLDILSSPKSYGATPAACYVPRLAIAAYHEGANEPWAIVGVCIECATLSTEPRVKEIHDAMPEYEAGLGKGADDIRAWCKELGFKGCAKQLTHYEAMEAEMEEE